MITDCITVPQPQILSEVKIAEPTPETEQRFKCHTCHAFFYERQFIVINKINHCPECGETHLRKMCKLDHNGCSHDVTAGIKYCPECGDPICPECGTHDVMCVSRVTGYLQDVGGWNAGKKQELKDRIRYNIPA